MLKPDGTKETIQETQERVSKLTFVRRKAVKSVGHPALKQRFRPVLSWDQERLDKNKKHRERVWPNKFAFVIVKGEFYDVRSDYKGNWFGPAVKNKDSQPAD